MKSFYAIIAVLIVAFILGGCDKDEPTESDKDGYDPLAGTTELIPVFVKAEDFSEEKGGKGRFVIFKDYSRNFPGIYSLDGEQFLEVIEKDDRYVARLPRGRYVLELVLENRDIIYPANILRPGDVIRYGWNGYYSY